MTAVPRLRRMAMLSVHTSPLEQPGTGDAGGMNVYVVETALRLARRGVEVDVFTRWWSATSPPGRTRGWASRTCRASCAPSPPG